STKGQTVRPILCVCGSRGENYAAAVVHHRLPAPGRRRSGAIGMRPAPGAILPAAALTLGMSVRGEAYHLQAGYAVAGTRLPGRRLHERCPMREKWSNARDIALSLLVLLGLALPFLPVPGDGTTRMHVLFHTGAMNHPRDFSVTTTRSVCELMAAALAF